MKTDPIQARRNRTGRAGGSSPWWAAAAAVFAGTLAMGGAASAKDCAELAGAALPEGKVVSATLVPAGGFQPPASPFGRPPGIAAAGFKTLPAFCRIQATLTPTPDSDIKVEVWMPASGWNGKLVGIGNGVWAGSISYFELGAPLSRGYAVAATDAGHVGNGLSAD
ncbi:MAG TPA: tannase/feruloyl esterase family alpha/beta hydrolase, partial [Caulobacteraceae bacterium]